MKEKEFIQGSIKTQNAKELLRKELSKAGLVNIDIEPTTLGHRIQIIAEKPGLIIGKKGKTVNRIKKQLEEDLGLEDVEIDVEEVKRRNLHPELIANWVKSMLTKGIRANRATKKAVNAIMDDGAMGAEVIVTGVITGANTYSRQEKASKGYLKKAGEETNKIRETTDSVILPQGKVGIKVKIAPPEAQFRDKTDPEEYIKSRTKQEDENEEKPEEEKKNEK